MANEFIHKSVGTVLTQSEWEATDGTGHQFDSQATGDIVYASSATVLSRLGVGTDGDLLNLGSGIPAWTSAISTAKTFADNILLGLGSGADGVLLNRSTVLAANTALTGVMIGTPVTPAVAANSLLVSNVTASGDFLLALNNGGNSQAWHWVDSSAGTQTLYAAGVARILLNSTGGSFTGTWSNLGTVTTVDLNGGSIDGAAIGAASHSTIKGTTIDATTDFTIGTTVITDDDITFGAAADIQTSAGALTLTPASDLIVTLKDDESGALAFNNSAVGYYIIDTRNASSGIVVHSFDSEDIALASSENSQYKIFKVKALTTTYTGGTTQTNESTTVDFDAMTFVGGSAIIVDAASTLKVKAPIESTNVTLAVTSALHIVTTTGTPTRQHGILIDTLSGGTSANSAITVGNTDADQEIIHVGVTGHPVFGWDESLDAFSFTHGIAIAAAEKFYLDGGGTTYIQEFSDADVRIFCNAIRVVDFVSNGVTYNENGVDVNFRVEGNTNANMIVMDAGLDVLAFGASAVGKSFLSIRPTHVSDASDNEASMVTIAGNLTGAATDTVRLAGLEVDTNIITQTATENIADIATLRVAEPNITDNLTGDITVASSVLIKGAPNEGENNYGLKIDATVNAAGDYLIGVGAGSDADLNILHVEVTGDPAIGWDESADAFSFNKGATFQTNNVRGVFSKTNITDNSATGVFTITTTNESSNNDFGGYYCDVRAIIGHRTDSDTGQGAVKGFHASFARHMLGTGAGVSTAVTEINESAEAGNDTGARGIGTVTMTAVETSEYVTTVTFQVDVTGSAADKAEVACIVDLVWVNFQTSPALAAA